MERSGALGLGHPRGQLRYLPQPYHGALRRLPGQPGSKLRGGVLAGLGSMQPCLSFPLHLQMAENTFSVPTRQ